MGGITKILHKKEKVGKVEGIGFLQQEPVALVDKLEPSRVSGTDQPT